VVKGATADAGVVTRSGVVALDDAGRVAELSRMLAGTTAGWPAGHAEELLEPRTRTRPPRGATPPGSGLHLRARPAEAACQGGATWSWSCSWSPWSVRRMRTCGAERRPVSPGARVPGSAAAAPAPAAAARRPAAGRACAAAGQPASSPRDERGMRELEEWLPPASA
jgi:hypothetical protein